MKTRKNKNYTSILLEEMTTTEFTKAKDLYNQLRNEQGLNVVIKPTNKAFKDMVQLHSQPVSIFEVNDTFRFLGVQFKVSDETDNLKGFEYYNHAGNLEHVRPLVTNDSPISIGLYEIAFESYTGILLYF